MEGDVDHRVCPSSLRVVAWHAHYFPLTSLRSIPALSAPLSHGRLVPWTAGFQLGLINGRWWQEIRVQEVGGNEVRDQEDRVIRTVVCWQTFNSRLREGVVESPNLQFAQFCGVKRFPGVFPPHRCIDLDNLMTIASSEM